jgi:2-methylcitrate dehydratase PrpD
MIQLAKMGVDGDAIEEITCETGEGLVHRLWEPLADKHAPPSGYAAKFSMPFCMAVGFYDGDAGLQQFTDEKAKDSRVLALTRKISYVIDPNNEYPRNYTGHIRVRMRDGKIHELRQPHMRGGMHEPLTLEDIVAKFRANVVYGGWSPALGEKLLAFCETLPKAPDLRGLAAFRC